MNRKGFFSAILVAIVFAVLHPALAGNLQRLRGDLLTAEFFLFGDCSTTDLWVQAIDGKLQEPPGNGTQLHEVHLGYYEDNWCTGEWRDFGGSSTVGLIQIDSKLETGSLQAAIEVFAYVSGLYRTIIVDLEFTADGPAIRETQTDSRSYPGFHMRSRYQGLFRPAAVTGAVWDGAENLIPSTPSGDRAEMATVRSGYIEID